MATTKIIVWSFLVAVLGFLAYRELQVVTLGFSFDPLYIPAKRSDVFRMLIDEPEIWVKIHPLCTGVSNIVRSQDADGRRIVEFDIQERVVLLGFYKISNITFHMAVKATKEDVSTQLKANVSGGMIQINQGFDLTDAENDKDGTMLGDHAKYTAPRILARLTLREAEAVEFDIQERVVLLGFYEISNITFRVAVKAIKEDVSTQLKANVSGGMIQINQGFDLTDAENGKNGTMFGDHAKYTAPRILARLTLREAEAAHTVIIQNIKQLFEEVSKKDKL